MTAFLAHDWPRAVLDFWFKELSVAQWFRQDAVVDGLIRDRFAATLESAAAVPEAELVSDPDTALAAIITLDQFPRNMFRGSAAAFAHDAKAVRLATLAVDRGDDQGRTVHERLFIYLPFEHSESPDNQARAVALISALGDAELTRYAEAHKIIIDRFGRFPHRNAILGRTSTPQEIAFLKEPMSSF
jgi:uncharacterized protein (DUF924 family)